MAALPIIAAVAGIAGAGVATYGAISSGEAAAANATYQSQVAVNNAAIAKQNASFDMASGEVEAGTEGLKQRAALGSIKAAQGANNIDVNSGSAVDVQTGAKELANVDTATIVSNASKKAYGDLAEASNQQAQSELLKQQAGQEETAGYVSGLGSFLSGVSSVGANWSKFQGFGTGGDAASSGGGAPSG